MNKIRHPRALEEVGRYNKEMMDIVVDNFNELFNRFDLAVSKLEHSGSKVKERRGILKTDKGLIQLRQCPVCEYFIYQSDAVMKRKGDVDDMGEVGACRFCKREQKIGLKP